MAAPTAMIRLAALLMLLTLAACAVAPSRSTLCPGLVTRDAVGMLRRAPSMTTEEAQIARTMTEVFAGPGERAARSSAPVNYLALSTGGIYGAFGAGFLSAWRDRPDFSIVTGLSAGSVLAPFAFAGPAFDDRMPFGPGADVESFARRRGVLGAFHSNAFYDAGNLVREVRENNTPALRAAITRKAASGHALLMGATNLRTGRMDVFDLGAYLSGPKADPDCLTQAVLASAAIPVVLPPRRIDDAVYADAGLRQSVFFRGIQAGKDATASRRPITAYMIVNANLAQTTADIRSEDIVTLGSRAIEIASDQLFRQSIREALLYARQNGWTVRATFARGVDVSDCKPLQPRALFSTCARDRLFAAGQDAARNIHHTGWLNAGQMLALLNEAEK